jgi:phosphoserine aminotransferase
MISFYPGPSRVHDHIPDYVTEAFERGILSINHRSDEFMEISERTINLLKNKLAIPTDYTIFYTTSATECWEMIAQSIVKESSFHFHSGAFGKKWYEYTSKICPGARSIPFDQNSLIDVNMMQLAKEHGVICLTQNETSNGTQVSNPTIQMIRQRYPQHLIAVDATSSMAGIYLDFQAADIWFASVQKCFGLPAGLGLMICSPSAMATVRAIGERKHYNSLTLMMEMMEKWQTPFTPNVLNIYVLMCVMDNSKPIHQVESQTRERYQRWVQFFKDKHSMRHLIDNEQARSLTVIPVKADETLVSSIKSRARKSGFLLGEGYGELKSSTFRIANFPAIKNEEIAALMDFLKEYD